MTEDGSKPIPDPTELTTEQLHREIGMMREYVLGEIQHVREISQVKFAGVDKGFMGMADRTLEQKQDTKAALDAALQAAKDAVALQTEASDKAIAKSEAATTKQIDALANQLQKTAEALDDKINEAKESRNKLEVRIGQIETAKVEKTDNTSKMLAGLAAIVSVIALIVLIYGQLK